MSYDTSLDFLNHRQKQWHWPVDRANTYHVAMVIVSRGFVDESAGYVNGFYNTNST